MRYLTLLLLMSCTSGRTPTEPEPIACTRMTATDSMYLYPTDPTKPPLVVYLCMPK